MRAEQQPDHINARGVAAVIAGVLVISAIGVTWVFLWLPAGVVEREAAPAISRDEPRVFQGVDFSLFREQAPGLALRARQEQYLQSYGWIDRERGVVRVPIGEAIDLYLSQAPSGARQPPPSPERTRP